MSETPWSDVKWFLQEQGQVKGPYNSDSLKEIIDKMDVRHQDMCLVWRRGYQEWMRASKWQPTEGTAITTMAQATEVASQTQVTRVVAQPKSPKPAENSLFRVQVNFVDQPMMTKSELLNLISKHQDITTIAIQDSKTKEWKEVYAFPEIVEKLGLSRRKHPRVPILAQFAGKTSRHETFHARIITISEGGVGFTDVYELKIGDEVDGQISSPHFFQPINIRAEVVYSGLDGFIGLKFSQINDESQAAIIDYIKKFGRTTQPE